MSAELEGLQNRKKELIRILRNPLGIGIPATVQAIKDINESILQTGTQPYHCSRCNFHHKSGQIYTEHLQYGSIPFEFPPIRPVQVEFPYQMPLIKIQWLKSDEYYKQLPPLIELTPVRFSPRHRIYLIYQSEIIGNVPAPKSSALWDRIGSEDSELKITYDHKMLAVSVFEYEKLQVIMKNFVILAELGHPDLRSALMGFYPRALDYIDRFLSSYSHPVLNDLRKSIRRLLSVPGKQGMKILL